MSRGDGTVRWLAGYCPPRLAAAVLTGAVVSAVLLVVAAPLSGYAFDLVLHHPADRGTLAVAAAVLGGSQLLRAAVIGGRQAASIALGARAERDLRQAALDRVIGGSGRALAGEQAVGVVVADPRIVRMAFYPGLDLVASSLAVLVAVTVGSAWYGPLALVAPVGYAVGYLLVVRRYLRSLTGAARTVRDASADLTAVLEETLSGLETVRDSNVAGTLWDRVAAAARRHRDMTVAQGAQERRAPLYLLLGVAQAVGFGVALLGLRRGELGAGAVVSYVGLLLLLAVPTFASFPGYSRIASGLAGAGRIRGLIDSHPEAAADLHQPGNGGATRIVFRDVTFGYPETGPIISRASFELPERGLTVVTGALGSGKTSLIRLIAGACRPTSGSVTINGVPVTRWHPTALARRTALIDADPMLFSLSIMDNIRMGRLAATDDEVMAAARRAGVTFADQLPAGYHTQVGGGGAELSGGERQRVALARALLSGTPVLLLDDLLTALDPGTAAVVEREVLAAAADRSVVVVSGRRSLLAAADLILHVGPNGVTAGRPSAARKPVH